MIPQMEPSFDDIEREAVDAYLRSGGFLTEFRVTHELERAIAAYTEVQHAVMVSSGQAALVTALMALGVGPGDEVIVPNYTMIATANAVSAVGATPVFVDVEASTLCLDFDLVRQAVSERTRAVALVAANGRTPEAGINAFVDFCRERGLFLLEDAAQGLGSHYPDGRHVGTAGDISILSFSVPKIITTGQGGCVLTNSDELATESRKIKDFGRVAPGNDIHERIGYNFKFTDLQATVGLAQFSKLEWRVARKKAIYERYQLGLAGRDGVQLFSNDTSIVAPWFIDCLVDDRDRVASEMRNRGVGSRPMYPPINAQVAYGVSANAPVSVEVGARGLWLPSSVQLTDEQVDEVCSILLDVIG